MEKKGGLGKQSVGAAGGKGAWGGCLPAVPAGGSCHAAQRVQRAG